MDLKYTNDLLISNGDLEIVDGAYEVGQQIEDRLKTFKGEWFLDLSFGPDYRKDILLKNPRLSIIAAVLKREILKSADVTFKEFETSFSDRKLTISYALKTTDGSITSEITI